MKKILVTLSLLIIPFTISTSSLAQVAQSAQREPCSDMAQIIEAEMKSQIVKRNLDDYEKLGPLCHELVDSPDHDVMARIRDFIWQHWKEKRRGFVVATFHSVEGAPSTFFMLIEPDAKGRWRIDTKIERKVFDWKSRQRRRETNGYVAYSVKRIPDNESLPIYHLVLRDKRRKRITEF